MLTNEDIKTTLLDIASSVSGITSSEQNEQLILHPIINDSEQAILFVSLIEDEFEIEFDDEDINLDFFTSLDYVTEILKKYLDIQR